MRNLDEIGRAEDRGGEKGIRKVKSTSDRTAARPRGDCQDCASHFILNINMSDMRGKEGERNDCELSAKGFAAQQRFSEFEEVHKGKGTISSLNCHFEINHFIYLLYWYAAARESLRVVGKTLLWNFLPGRSSKEGKEARLAERIL